VPTVPTVPAIPTATAIPTVTAMPTVVRMPMTAVPLCQCLRARKRKQGRGSQSDCQE
jgi:hypothetical protein